MNYERIYNQIIERSNSRILKGYKEKHHIIPKCLGGCNDKTNIAILTAREHFICHMLLCKIYPKHIGLTAAFWMFCNKRKNKFQDKNYKVSARTYEIAKKEMAEMISLLNTGKKPTPESIAKGQITRLKNFKPKEKPPKPPKPPRKIRKGVPKPKGFGEKISKIKTGQKFSPIHCKHLSESRKGKPSWRKGLHGTQAEESLIKMRHNQPGRRTILQFDQSNNFIKEWNSIQEAVRTFGVGVSHVLMGRQPHSKGFVWKYADGLPANKRKGGKHKKEL